ncbi:MAG: DUF2062 domain-containing protein, partial [Pseudomonadota bacterium]
WARAFEYVRLRVNRLPGTPETIARGIWAGVFTSFTPFYGLHFVVAVAIAFVMRGNILAALLGTFFGNPLTYVPIALSSMYTGHALLGIETDQTVKRSLGQKFVDAAADLWHNFLAIFTDQTAEWTRLLRFWDEVFFPYMVGGIVPGIIVATICYYLCVPVIRAYQKRRKGRLIAKLAQIKNKAVATAKRDGSQTGE